MGEISSEKAVDTTMQATCHLIILSLVSPALLAPKLDFKTVCRNGCPAFSSGGRRMGGGGGRALAEPEPEPESEPEAGPESAPLSIPEIVTTNKDFSTLLAAVAAAGLVEALSTEGPFTVFAPTNDAFAKVPSAALAGLLEDKDALTAVLARHVIVGASIMAGDINVGITEVETLGGEKIEVIKAGPSVTLRSSAGTANVILADAGATNGVI